MVTVLNNPSVPNTERTTMIERSSDDSAGWAVAVIILLAVVAVAGFLWMRYYSAPAVPASNGGTNINVTLPESQSQTPGATTPQQGTTPPANQTAPAQ
jgi:hypothetical protein